MDNFVKIAKTTDIIDNSVKKFTVDGQEVAVANLAGQYFAIDNLCSHRQCSLADGEISGQNIICPCHGGQFNIQTGAALVMPAVTPIKTFEVKVENDEIWIKV